jgi:tRNA (guanine37-N1)-methyltransferase
MTGGEVAALALVDSIVRLLPGTLNADSLIDESFNDSKLEYIEHDQYTKPALWRGKAVPEVLLNGNHNAISLHRTSSSQVNSAKIK